MCHVSSGGKNGASFLLSFEFYKFNKQKGTELEKKKRLALNWDPIIQNIYEKNNRAP